MTMFKTLHLRNDQDRLYVSRKEGGRRITRIEDSIDACIKRLKDNIQKSKERLITATRNNNSDTKISRRTIT